MLFGAVVALVGAAVVLGAWRELSPASRSPVDLEVTRRASHDAVRALREDAPAAARLVERLIATAETAGAQEASAPIWRRSPGRVEAAWSRVMVASTQALVVLRARQRGWQSRWGLLETGAGAEVRRALVESGESGVGRLEIAAAQQARLRWELAERYAAAGEYDRAVTEAEQARTHAEVVHRSFLELHSRFLDPKNLVQWRSLANQTIAQSRASGETAFVVDKLERRLYVYLAGKRVGTYEAELGAKGLRRKLHTGDQATPEGRYRVTEVRGIGRTQFYKALLIDYPNLEDRARYSFGRRAGQVPPGAGIGSLIEIHGDGGQGRDWTDGCVALANHDMDAVFARAHVGTPVTIVGTLEEPGDRLEP